MFVFFLHYSYIKLLSIVSKDYLIPNLSTTGLPGEPGVPGLAGVPGQMGLKGKHVLKSLYYFRSILNWLLG